MSKNQTKTKALPAPAAKTPAYQPPAAPISPINEKGACSVFRTKATSGTIRVLYRDYSPLFTKVMLTENALKKMQYYVKFCDKEVGWLGTCVRKKDYLLIEDFFMFQQEVSSGETDIDSESIAIFAENMFENPPEGMSADDVTDLIDSIRVWGHSHVNMAVNPSTTDEETMGQFTHLSDSERPYMIRIIANKSGSVRIDVFHYDIGLVQEDIAWDVERVYDPLADEILSEMKEKVKPQKPQPTITPIHNYNNKNNKKAKTKTEATESDLLIQWHDQLNDEFPEYFDGVPEYMDGKKD